MAKKKIDLGMIATLAAAVLGVIAIIMLALPAIANKVSTDTVYSGWDVAFGLTEKATVGGATISREIFKFSFMNVLTYLLVIAGIACTVLNYLGKGGKYMNLIATVTFLLAGIFFFLVIPFSMPNVGGEATIEEIAELKEEFFKLGAGAIIGGICSILAAVASGYKAFILK